jgi:hypothetical protein
MKQLERLPIQQKRANTRRPCIPPENTDYLLLAVTKPCISFNDTVGSWSEKKKPCIPAKKIV